VLSVTFGQPTESVDINDAVLLLLFIIGLGFGTALGQGEGIRFGY